MPTEKSKSVERVALGACILLIVAAYSLTQPTEDFIEYWVSGHLVASGQNPYSLSDVMSLEQALGWKDRVPLMNLSPPWALPFVAPLSLVNSYSEAWLLWVLIMCGVLAYSARILLDLYSGGRRVFPDETRLSESLIAFTFFPALLCLRLAQITTLALFAFSAFLYFESRRRYVLAGFFLAVATVKPQLGYLIWIAILLECLQPARWKILVGLASGLALLSSVALLLRPTVFHDYAVLTHSGYLAIWQPAIGGMLRSPSADMARSFPLQFLAPVFGMVWFCYFWLRHGMHWIWCERMPVLITVSVFTAPYAWTFDQVLFLIPIVALTCRYLSAGGGIPRVILWLYSLVNLATLLAFSPKGPAFLAAPLAILYARFSQHRSSNASPEDLVSQILMMIT